MAGAPGTLGDLWPGGSAGVVEPPPGTDAWALHAAGAWLLIPTNTQRKSDGTAVMGAGLALSAARRFPDLPSRYGRLLAAGQPRSVFADHRLLLGPTKTDWRMPSSLDLVATLLDAVASWADAHPHEAVVVPSPGCGRGGLAWDAVRVASLERLAGRRVALLAPL